MMCVEMFQQQLCVHTDWASIGLSDKAYHRFASIPTLAILIAPECLATPDPHLLIHFMGGQEREREREPAHFVDCQLCN